MIKKWKVTLKNSTSIEVNAKTFSILDGFVSFIDKEGYVFMAMKSENVESIERIES